jgi:hypothetical protein
MALSLEQQLIADLMGYQPMNTEEGREPADTSLCNRKIEMIDNWPYIRFNGEMYPVPTMEEMEEWVFDSVCFTPAEDEVEPDHPHSWLSILGMI